MSLISKRGVLRTALSLLALAATASSAIAQSWPSKPVRLIVPAGAGAAPDVIARIIGEKLSAAWGQGVVVDNKPGAGGIPGMSALARSTTWTPSSLARRKTSAMPASGTKRAVPCARPPSLLHELPYSILSFPYLRVDAFSPACPLKVRVGANSPNLCPTISSVT